jgi:hypothetical protein
MDHKVEDEPRSWWLPETDAETAARQLHDGLERLREHVAAYRARRMRMDETRADDTAAPPH